MESCRVNRWWYSLPTAGKADEGHHRRHQLPERCPMDPSVRPHVLASFQTVVGDLLGPGDTVYTSVFFMVFEWDSSKSEANLRERGFDLASGARVFQGVILEVRDRRRDYGEVRTWPSGSLKASS